MKRIFLIILCMVMSNQMYSQNERSVDEARGLTVGSKAPDIVAIDANRTAFKLSDMLDKGPVVIIFFRGYWCPVCNKHLAQIQDSLSLIEEKGATVLAISPERPEYLKKMAHNSGATFTLLYDEGYRISDAYDVTFSPKKTELILYNTTLGANLKKTHSDSSERLPIPATYVIDEEGIITWRQFNPDYKKRSTVKDILKNLPQ